MEIGRGEALDPIKIGAFFCLHLSTVDIYIICIHFSTKYDIFLYCTLIYFFTNFTKIFLTLDSPWSGVQEEGDAEL